MAKKLGVTYADYLKSKAAKEVKPAGPDLKNYKKPVGPAVDADPIQAAEELLDKWTKQFMQMPGGSERTALVAKIRKLRESLGRAVDSEPVGLTVKAAKTLLAKRSRLHRATDRRSRLHAALDAVMTYSKPPVIRKTLSILNPADLAKMTGSSEPQYIGKGKPYTGFAKDSMGVCPVCKTQAPVVRGVFARHWVDGAVCSGSGSIQAKDETPQEKARRKLSPDQAARLKELLAKVKPAPSAAAAPMPRAKDSQHWMPVGDRGPYKCDQCNGTGKFPPGKTCPRCGGSGIMNQNDPVILNVGDRVKYDKQPPVYTVTSKSYNTSLNKYYYDIRREDGKQERKGLPIYYLSKV